MDRTFHEHQVTSFRKACHAHLQERPSGVGEYVNIGFPQHSWIFGFDGLLPRHRGFTSHSVAFLRASWRVISPSPTRSITCKLGAPGDGQFFVSTSSCKFLTACHAIAQERPEGAREYVKIVLFSHPGNIRSLGLLRRHRVCPFHSLAVVARQVGVSENNLRGGASPAKRDLRHGRRWAVRSHQ